VVTSYQIFAQSIAILALGVFALSFQAKLRSRILLIQALGLASLAIHYFLLSAWSGFTLTMINSIITALFIFKERIEIYGKSIFLYVSILIMVTATVFSWESFYSVFALIGVSAAIVSKWQDSPQSIRIIALFSSIFWIIYNYFAGSYGGIVAETIILASIFISLLWNGAIKSRQIIS